MAKRAEDPTIRKYSDVVVEGLRQTNVVETCDDVRGAVIAAVFNNLDIKKAFDGAAIRYAAMCGEVAKDALAVLGGDSEFIQLLSIGDIDLPEFVREAARDIVEVAHSYHVELLDEVGYGYDLSAKGAEVARDEFFDYIDGSYGLSRVDGLKEIMLPNSTIVSGAMRGLDDIATARVREADTEGKKHRFVSPDNSFGTWLAISKLRSHGEHSTHVVDTEQSDLLHVTADKVKGFYEENPEADTNDTWCITPVGNPSGTYTSGENLADACAEIVKCNPSAVIVLDCTYVRTLTPEKSLELIGGIIKHSEILDRILFIDSFSKTHGFCGERVGMYFSTNDEIYNPIQTTNMTLSAGNGTYRSALVRAFSNTTPEREEKLRRLYDFWHAERRGLYDYLMGGDKNSNLFAADQSHVQDSQLDEPLGIYVFLKLMPGVTSVDVLKQAGCLGVETQMGEDTYVRFAVGKIKEPTYSGDFGFDSVH